MYRVLTCVIHTHNILTIKRKGLDRGCGSDLQIEPIPLNNTCTCAMHIRNIPNIQRKGLDRGCGFDLQIACCQRVLQCSSACLYLFLPIHLHYTLMFPHLSTIICTWVQLTIYSVPAHCAFTCTCTPSCQYIYTIHLCSRICAKLSVLGYNTLYILYLCTA